VRECVKSRTVQYVAIARLGRWASTCGAWPLSGCIMTHHDSCLLSWAMGIAMGRFGRAHISCEILRSATTLGAVHCPCSVCTGGRPHVQRSIRQRRPPPIVRCTTRLAAWSMLPAAVALAANTSGG